MRDKGVGMGKYIGRVTSPITGEAESIPSTGYAFSDTQENRKNYKGFVRYLSFENGLGVILNLITTVFMCWLAWALLMPEGKVPEGWQIAVVQSAFFEVAWGPIGKAVFLVVAAAFLCDAWLQLTDGYSRIQADYFCSNFQWAKRFHFRTWHYMFVVLFTVLTAITMLLAQPGALIIIRGVIAFLSMGIYCPALIYLNFYMLPKAFPAWVKPHWAVRTMMFIVTAIYIGVGLWYVWILIKG